MLKVLAKVLCYGITSDSCPFINKYDLSGHHRYPNITGVREVPFILYLFFVTYLAFDLLPPTEVPLFLLKLEVHPKCIYPYLVVKWVANPFVAMKLLSLLLGGT